MSPLFLWKGTELRALLGTPGSFGIPQTSTQLILNVVDFGMDMQAAIEAPRVRLPETNPVCRRFRLIPLQYWLFPPESEWQSRGRRRILQGCAHGKRPGQGMQPQSELGVVAEKRISAEVLAGLERRGHEIDLQEDWTAAVGGMQGIAVDAQSGVFTGGADPRRDGYVIGW